MIHSMHSLIASFSADQFLLIKKGAFDYFFFCVWYSFVTHENVIEFYERVCCFLDLGRVPLATYVRSVKKW